MSKRKENEKKRDEESKALLAQWRHREGREVSEIGQPIKKKGKQAGPATTRQQQQQQQQQQTEESPAPSPSPSRERRPSEAAMLMFPTSAKKERERQQSVNSSSSQNPTSHEGEPDAHQSSQPRGTPVESSNRSSGNQEAVPGPAAVTWLPNTSPERTRGIRVKKNRQLMRMQHSMNSSFAAMRPTRRHTKRKNEAETLSVKFFKQEYARRGELGKLEALRQMRSNFQKKRAKERQAIEFNPLHDEDETRLRKVVAYKEISGEKVLLDPPAPFQVGAVDLPTVSRNQRLLYEKIDPSTLKTPMPTAAISVYNQSLLAMDQQDDDEWDGGESELLGDEGSTDIGLGHTTRSSAGQGQLVPVRSVGARSVRSVGAMTVTSSPERPLAHTSLTLSARPRTLPSLKEVNRVVDEVCGPAVSRSQYAFGNAPSYWDRLNLYQQYTDAVAAGNKTLNNNNARRQK